jgi:hypothetical protein
VKSHSNIKSIIELYNKNIVKLTLEELNKDGISKIIKPLNLKEDDKGIYICFKNQTLTVDNIVYIGKAGTILQNGEFKQQSLKKRLTNSRNNKTAKKYFVEKMEGTHIEELVILCCVVSEKTIPAYLEACLIQDYYNQKNVLPEWNVAL